MNYVELKIAISDAEQAEILTAELADYPFESFLVEGDTLKAYIPEAALAECKSAVNSMLHGRGVMCHMYTPVAEQNWNAAWESGFEAVDIDGRLRIRAPFHEPALAGTEEVVIMPHMSFGTGHHVTTRLMAAALLGLNVSGRRGLDMGSGTGVLAIIAARHGAEVVDAVDIDEWAAENGQANAEANGVAGRVHSILGDVHAVERNRYDFILANINRNVLTADMPVYAAMLAPGGDLLLSGFLEEDAPVVRASAEAQGLRIEAVRPCDGWAVIHCVKR